MKKIAALALACSLTAFGCPSGEEGPGVKAPKMAEGRVTFAKIAGRDLPIYTFTGRMDNDEAEIVAVRVLYSITGELYKRADGKVALVEPVSLEGTLVKRLHQLRYITDKVKDHDLEAYFQGDNVKIAFRWEIDYKAPEGEQVGTVQSIVYETDRKDIEQANLGREIKP